MAPVKMSIIAISLKLAGGNSGKKRIIHRPVDRPEYFWKSRKRFTIMCVSSRSKEFLTRGRTLLCY